MILCVGSNVAYLVLLKGKSCLVGYFYLSNHPNQVIYLTINGAILVAYKNLRHIVSSSAEAKTTGVFMNT